METLTEVIPQGALARTDPEFSVVLCAYTEDRWEAMLSAVQAVREQALAPREIILVIDHNPGLFQRARRYLTDITVIENRQERGLSGARNTGIAAASAELIAFVDEDAIPAPAWLENLKCGYENEDIMGIGGRIDPLWEVKRPAWFPAEFDWVVGCTYKGLPQTVSPVRNLIGCNMSFRKDVFELVGGFRSDLGRLGAIPAGCEETELCIRIQQRLPGKQLLYQPEAQVRHRVPSQRATWAYFWSRCFSEGLSKARVAQLVGSRDGLNTERSYVYRTLWRGAIQGLGDGFLKADLSGFGQAFSIVSGLAVTTAGYIYGSISAWVSGLKKAKNRADKSEQPEV